MLRPTKYLNYVDEYFDLVFNKYIIREIKFFGIYFKLDLNNSVIDDTKYVQSGTYEIIGRYSGYKWIKILNFPIYAFENIGPVSHRDNEEGVIREYELRLVIPDILKIEPDSRDFIFIKDNQIFKETQGQPLFEVVSKEESHVGLRNFYKITCRNSFYKLEELDNNKYISRTMIYNTFFHKIYPLKIGNYINNVLNLNQYYFENVTRYSSYSIIYDRNLNLFVNNI